MTSSAGAPGPAVSAAAGSPGSSRASATAGAAASGGAASVGGTAVPSAGSAVPSGSPRAQPAASAVNAGPGVASSGSGGEGDWPVYHRDPARTGVGADQPSLAAAKQAWSAQVDGNIYAEPLVVGNRVYVATENDTIYALDAGSGSVIWQKHVGEPVPRSALPCGDIDPSGMTATPAIDVARKELYAVGRFQPTQHELWVLDLDSGNEKYHRTVDPPGADPRYLQERGALSLANGRVYIPFGGNFGDCGPYKGWMIAGQQGDASGPLLNFAVPTQREGAIWAPPGAVVDGGGDLLVATGNAESAGDFDYANAVIRLSADLKMKDYWAPSDWQALSRSDTDIGSVSPTLLEGNQVFQIGKAGVGYLLNAGNLGKIGGEAFKAQVCRAGFGGTAYQPPLLYVPCTDGLIALRVQPNHFDIAWRVSGQQLNSPIVAYGSVWSVDGGSATLFQVNPADGSVRNRLQLPGPTVAHFLTPTAAGGKIFVTSGKNVLAFGG